MPEHYDVIIVGAGMAGGILAARIAERGVNPKTGDRLRIALMDMGPYYKGDPKPGYGIPLRRQQYANLPGFDDFRMLTPWGTVAAIGGQSVHWGAQALLPAEEDHDDWVSETGVDWTYEKLTEARIEITEMFHIAPEPEETMPPGAFQFRDAATKMGYKVYRYPAAKLNCVRCGYCRMKGCKYDCKSSSLVRYIPIAEKFGVEIMPETKVEKVILEKTGASALAKGVVYTRAGKTEEARADYVILSCNSRGTTALLFNSGYGPRDRVNDPIAENPNVGKNARMSFLFSDVGLFDEPIKREMGWDVNFYFVEKGPQGHMNLMIRDLFGSLGSVGYNPTDMAVNDIAPAFGVEHKQFMKKWLHFGHVEVMVSREDYVRGEVDRTGKALLNPNHPAILKRIQEGREIARDLMLKMGAKKTTDLKKPVELRVTGITGVPGPCRAGKDRSNSVINSDFQCHDIDNLFVCDNSVMPKLSTTENYGAATAMLACHAWRRIVANHFS